MELYKKYRPKSFKRVIGQNLSHLQKMMEEGHVPSFLFFSGPSGCGKTTIARIVARQLGCSSSDFYEINAAEKTGIDGVREIKSMLHRSTSLSGTVRVYLIDECHKLSSAAQSALLKMLEDTPKGSYFMLATTEPGKLISTIRTRGTEVRVKSLTDADTSKLLKVVSSRESFKLSNAVATKITEHANGSARKALVLLDQVYLLKTEEEQLNAVTCVPEEETAFKIAQMLMRPSTKWKTIADFLKRDEIKKGGNIEGIRHLILSYASTVCLSSGGGPHVSRAYLIMDTFREPFFHIGFPGLVMGCYEVVAGVD